MRILALFILIQSLSTHACPSYKQVQTGESAPCSGYFFNPAAEKKIRDEVQASGLKTKQIELKDLQIDRLTTDSEEWQAQAKKQAELAKDREGDFKNGMIWGVAGTILSILLIKQVSK